MAAIDELDWKEHERHTGVNQALTEIPCSRRKRHRRPPCHAIEVRSDGETLEHRRFGPAASSSGARRTTRSISSSKFVSRHHAQLDQ